MDISDYDPTPPCPICGRDFAAGHGDGECEMERMTVLSRWADERPDDLRVVRLPGLYLPSIGGPQQQHNGSPTIWVYGEGRWVAYVDGSRRAHLHEVQEMFGREGKYAEDCAWMRGRLGR